MATVSFNHGSPSTVEVEVGNILGSVLEQLPMKINGPLHNYSTYVNLDFNDGKIKSGNSSPSLSKSVSWSVYGVPGPWKHGEEEITLNTIITDDVTCEFEVEEPFKYHINKIDLSAYRDILYKDGYYLAGWAFSEDGSVKFSDIYPKTIVDSEDEIPKMLCAIWRESEIDKFNDWNDDDVSEDEIEFLIEDTDETLGTVLMEGFPEFVSGISKLANLSDSGEPDWESTHGVIHIVDFFSNKDEIVYGKLDLSIGDILSDIPEYSYIDENGITHDQIGWSYVGHDSDFNMQYGNLVVLKDTLGKLTNGNSYPIYIMPKFHYKVTFKTESIENETYEWDEHDQEKVYNKESNTPYILVSKNSPISSVLTELPSCTQKDKQDKKIVYFFKDEAKNFLIERKRSSSTTSYEFTGWSFANNQMVDINKTLITGDIECYARYTSTSTEYSEIVISSVEEEGYTFNGWVNKKGDSLEVDDDNKYHPRADGDEEWFAVLEANKYTLTFNDDGVISGPFEYIEFGKELNIPKENVPSGRKVTSTTTEFSVVYHNDFDKNFTSTGTGSVTINTVLDGWFDAENGNGNKFFDGNNSINKNKDYFDENGKWNYPHNIVLYSDYKEQNGEKVPIILSNPEPVNGYIFKGWKDSISSEIYPANSEFKRFEGTTDLYAIWEKIIPILKRYDEIENKWVPVVSNTTDKFIFNIIGEKDNDGNLVIDNDGNYKIDLSYLPQTSTNIGWISLSADEDNDISDGE